MLKVLIKKARYGRFLSGGKSLAQMLVSSKKFYFTIIINILSWKFIYFAEDYKCHIKKTNSQAGTKPGQVPKCQVFGFPSLD